MKKILIAVPALFIALGLTSVRVAWSDNDDQQVVYDAQPGDALFTPDELHDLLAPIALYPDPLIAQILPAATFIDQIDEAARYVRQYGKSARIDDQPWDVSVRAVAHYPDVLFMMDQKYDWSVSLGQAFVNQQQDVMDTIQQLRAEAANVGNLVSTPQQQVITDSGTISIVPASPDVVYVPLYDPLVVYVEPPYPSYGFVTFGTGFTIGVWLNRDCDWRRHRVYYHGWRGEGWIRRARPHINDRNRIYINNRYATITINQRVMQHDTRRFREDIRHNVQLRGERRGQPGPQGRTQQPRATGAPHVTPPRPITTPPPPAVRTPTPAAQSPRPATTTPRPPQLPDKRDVYRGREPRGTQTAPFSGYGGYGSKSDAKTYRERGQTSRENIHPVTGGQPSPVRAQSPAPAQRKGGLGGKPVAPPAARQFTPPATRQSTPPAAQQPSRQTAPAAPTAPGGREQRPQR